MLKFISNTWGSGDIRGKQIASFLGVPCDVKAEKGDIFVAVKSIVMDAEAAKDTVKSLWIDVVDGYGVIDHLMEHPWMKAIAISRMAFEFIRNRVENEMVIIPEHHCNFNNETRPEDREVRVVGAACYPGNFDLDPTEVRDALASIGLDFRIKTEFKNQQEVIDFYKSMDIQFCFRKFRGIENREPPELKNPLKLENAGSFKIPTVSYPEPNFIREFGQGTFMPVRNLTEVVDACKKLKEDKGLYNIIANFAYDKAQQFHIARIAPLYLNLD